MNRYDLSTPFFAASMKVPPKRKGNAKFLTNSRMVNDASMKVPPKRKGNVNQREELFAPLLASMKVPPKRKGNGWLYGEGDAVDEPQ